MMKNQKLVRDIFSRIPNLRIPDFFWQKMSCNLLRELESVFLMKINSFSNIFDLSRKKTYLVLKEKQEKFCEKKLCVNRFRIRESMS